MTDQTTFSLRNNAKRAAERMIDDGSAPSIDYKLHTREDGRIEIIWQTGITPDQADAIDVQIATERLAAIEAGEVQIEPVAIDAPWPAPGDRVRVAISKRQVSLGTIDYQVDPDHFRVFLDGAPPVSELYRRDQLSAPGDEAPAPEKKERRARSRPIDRKPSREADLDAAAAQGTMPEKPIVTSKANPHYQKRFDRLADLAAHGDWDAVRSYEVKGINSYAKMVKLYRDRLLAAHAAQSTEEAS